MQLLHSRGTYSKDHGANLREQRRAFATETAGALAKAGMAEVERRQTGETRRASMAEAGKEARHLREFGPEGTAAQRLSWTQEQATKEKAANDFSTRAGGVMGEFVKKDSAGNEVLDPRLEAAWARAKSLGIEDPAEGLAYLSKAVKFLKGQGKVADEGAGEDVGKQAPRLSGKTIEEQLSSMEDISLAESFGFIAPEKAQKLKEKELLWQKLAARMPMEEAIVPQTRGTDYYDLSYGRSRRLGEMR